MSIPKECPACGGTKLYCNEMVWNLVDKGEVEKIVGSDGYQGHYKCADDKCGYDSGLE